MKKILIITAGLGNGHNTAAKGIYDTHKNNITDIQIIDIVTVTFMGKILQFFFHHLPVSLLHKIFDSTNNPLPSSWEIFFYTFFFKKITKIIQQQNPDTLFFTFPCFTLCIPKNYSGKIITQVTDYMTPHKTWLWGNPTTINVLDTESQKKFSQYLDIKKIKIESFPLPKANIKQNHQLKKYKNIILFFHNALLGNENEVIDQICKKYTSYTVIILAGRNYSAFSQLYTNNTNIQILPWVENIEKFYEKASIVGGKCGGAFISEVIKRNLPLIITGVFSGQEQGNYQYLQKYYAEKLITL